MCLLVSKIILRDPRMCLVICRVETSGYDSLGIILRFLDEDPKVVHEAAKAAQVDDPNDAA